MDSQYIRRSFQSTSSLYTNIIQHFSFIHKIKVYFKFKMMSLAMLISITVVVIILVLLTIIVCRMCFRKPERPASKYMAHRSAASGEHILNNTDVGRPSLSDSVCAHSITPKRTPEEALFANPFDDNDIIRKKVANNLIAKADRLSEPTPTRTRVLSRFLAQHDDHIHAGVVVCKTTPDQNECQTNITVFDKALSPNTVKRITALYEEHELAQKNSTCKKTKPTFINIPTDSEFDLLRRIQTSCLNRKLSITQRMSENSGLKLPSDESLAQGCQHLQCASTENTKESGYTIYGDASVFQFIDTIPNEILTKEIIKKMEA